MTLSNAIVAPNSPSYLVLDIDEAVAVLRCGRTTVYSLIASGEIQGVKIGRRRLVTYASIEAYIARQVEASAVSA